MAVIWRPIRVIMVISEGRMLAGIPVGLITIRAEKLTLGTWSNACPLWGAGVPKVPNISPFALKLLTFADGLCSCSGQPHGFDMAGAKTVNANC